MFYVITLGVLYVGFMVWAFMSSFDAMVTEPVGYSREKASVSHQEEPQTQSKPSAIRFAEIEDSPVGIDFMEDDVFYDGMFQ